MHIFDKNRAKSSTVIRLELIQCPNYDPHQSKITPAFLVHADIHAEDCIAIGPQKKHRTLYIETGNTNRPI